MKVPQWAMASVIVSYGVAAARGGPIEDIKSQQDWLTKVQSFHVRFDVSLPEATVPVQPYTLEVAFDAKRLYRCAAFNNNKDLTFWDGTTLFSQANAGYVTLSDDNYFTQNFSPGMYWGRAGQQFWWVEQGLAHMPASVRRTNAATYDIIGAPGAYTPAKDQTFDGVLCHVMEHSDHERVVYISADDGRWRGMKSSFSTYIFRDYKEVSKGNFYPMIQATAYDAKISDIYKVTFL